MHFSDIGHDPSIQLGNEGFVKKAPQKIIEEEKAKKIKYQEMYDKTIERLKGLKKD
jgi:valyl-tRNA synthetase